MDTLAESARMLHDFAAALLSLEPAAGDRILDLGAGACWCSDLLGRLNRPAISVDISLDMLRAGRSRPGTSIRAAAGDMEALPFRSGTFQKAICLSAIHHVPDIPKAIREIARVLDDGGVALFSEPGQGHADAAVSTAAVRDFGVLEQEILIGPFIRQGVQLLDAEERLVTRDYHRVALPHDVAPWQAVALSFECPVPQEPGRHGMKLDFVAEGIMVRERRFDARVHADRGGLTPERWPRVFRPAS